jgi:hypothetical protein
MSFQGSVRFVQFFSHQLSRSQTTELKGCIANNQVRNDKSDNHNSCHFTSPSFDISILPLFFLIVNPKNALFQKKLLKVLQQKKNESEDHNKGCKFKTNSHETGYDSSHYTDDRAGNDKKDE